MNPADRPRCPWCGTDPDYVAYHDIEWGVPETEDNRLFELLTLEGAQAGLSWLTILRKRDGYRTLFEDFDPHCVRAFSNRKIEKLLTDKRIVRNRLKVESTVSNADAFLKVADEYGTFASYIWDYVDGTPIQNSFQTMNDVPATTPLATRISKDMKKRGLRFVGPTIAYAFMQSAGLVNDHLTGCFRYEQVARLGRQLSFT